MGELPSKVYMTGCPSIDLAVPVLKSPKLDFDPFSKYKGVGESFSLDEPFIVVMQHPVTTEYERSRIHIEETLQAIHTLNMPTFWFWPNVDAGADGTSRGIRVFREKMKPTNIHFFKNMEPDDFLRLLNRSACLIGNSSVGIRECAFLGVPVVNIGSRQSGRERGANVIDVDYDRNQIVDAIRKHLVHGHYPSESLYGDGSAGKRIADLLEGIDLNVDKKLAY
jgi:UDP-hydrolysing UDP-N-acetyl-D-glucosamine 2-epimerase